VGHGAGNLLRSISRLVELSEGVRVWGQVLFEGQDIRQVEDAWGALLQTDTPQGRNLKLGRDALVSLGIETGISLRYGSVVDQILAEIREGEYELVALGSTYAARSLRRYFVRSITDLVVEQAGRPVLVMRNVS